MKSPEEVRRKVRTRYDRNWRAWAVGDDPATALEIPLDPPTEKQLLDGAWDDARRWAQAWAAVDAGRASATGVSVQWATRRWASAGAQTLPDRLVLDGPEAVARFAGQTSHWDRAVRAVDRFRSEWPAAQASLGPAVQSVLTDLVRLPAADLERAIAVLRWLEANETDGLWARQLPVRGVDTKWVESHKRLVNRLRRAVGGAEDFQPLLEPPAYRRVRFLDPVLRPAGVTDLALPDRELIRLPVAPERVLVLENLQTLLALPDLPGTVAVHGGGYAPGDLARVPWFRTGRLQYWGDLDSHGLSILHRFRTAGVDASSVLMDAATLEAHRDLCGTEPRPARGPFPLLTLQEEQSLRLLRDGGDLRLEQERIGWGYALERLRSTA
ncbi:Wadjet anti-phage system protein JetD domain-containing protein [Kocuria nitroreducens]|uniref:Wadjet anti-phage system protein JetD domain-containing protein n=1 Tax=Kocuria nitroreducens TaxID=3058914 RepID=UPI0036DBD065